MADWLTTILYVPAMAVNWVLLKAQQIIFPAALIPNVAPALDRNPLQKAGETTVQTVKDAVGVAVAIAAIVVVVILAGDSES